MLTWNGQRARDLMKIAKEAPGHRLSYAERHSGRREAEPALWFVKDEGVYLMPNERRGDGATSRVEYAHGLGPGASYFLIREICGGDDFCEVLYIDGLEEALEGCGFENDWNLGFRIRLCEEEFAVEWFLDPGGSEGGNGTAQSEAVQ